uniref:ABC transmembrane type-1 domain-containing protein n=1 Tax=Parascaris equorum TaxID=6256 RepID=A0A914R5D7_PAREQ
MTSIVQALDVRMVQIVNNLVALAVTLVLGIAYCWQVGLLGLGFTLLVLFLLIVVSKFMDKTNDTAIREDFTGQLSIEIVEQVRTIQLLTREKHFCKRFDGKLDAALVLQKKCGPPEAVCFTITMAFPFFADMVTYALGISLLYYGHAKADEVFA